MIAIYAVIHGYAHHHGTAFVAAITALWIAWPTRKNRPLFSARETWALHGMVGATSLPVCREYLGRGGRD